MKGAIAHVCACVCTVIPRSMLVGWGDNHKGIHVRVERAKGWKLVVSRRLVQAGKNKRVRPPARHKTGHGTARHHNRRDLACSNMKSAAAQGAPGSSWRSARGEGEGVFFFGGSLAPPLTAKKPPTPRGSNTRGRQQDYVQTTTESRAEHEWEHTYHFPRGSLQKVTWPRARGKWSPG